MIALILLLLLATGQYLKDLVVVSEILGPEKIYWLIRKINIIKKKAEVFWNCDRAPEDQ